MELGLGPNLGSSQSLGQGCLKLDLKFKKFLVASRLRHGPTQLNPLPALAEIEDLGLERMNWEYRFQKFKDSITKLSKSKQPRRDQSRASCDRSYCIFGGSFYQTLHVYALRTMMLQPILVSRARVRTCCSSWNMRKQSRH